MKLYRVKRLSDGKFYRLGSDYCWAASFDTTGGFFKGEDTIRKHLFNLCCEWKEMRDARGNFYWRWGTNVVRTKVAGGPFWERLDLYEVDILVVLDSETIKQPAKDFMGILEDA